MINSPFFTQFLKASNGFTFAAIAVMVIAILVMRTLAKKVSFSKRMMIGLGLGLLLGIGIDLIGTNSALYQDYARVEISVWYALIGSGFIRLVQLLAVPVVFLSIIKVMVDVDASRIKKLTSKTFIMLLGTTAISALVGILVVNILNLQGSNFAAGLSESQIQRMSGIAAQSFPEFFLNLIPNNMLAVMSNNSSIVSVVIVGALIATSIRFLNNKKPETVKPLNDVLDSLRTTINSVLINIIKLMPYGIIGLVSNTIISNGLTVIKEMGAFIIGVYLGVAIMLVVYVIILLASGINPITFFKKAFPTMVLAFSSRSSLGTLPHTLQTLQDEMGVSGQTANFVGTLGTTIGMNGCAGVFPAMLGTLVASAVGLEVNIAFYLMVIVVVTIGSIGIAGVPGTATVAATVTLNGLGLGEAIPHIGAVFGVDPIVDMGRTMLNVTGSMLSAVVVDKWDGHFDQDHFNSK
ncbi:MAG TPA: cation:dicarboxylase symporter family transporter [Erysipelothrix sp.]|nr:cation:dicarboxylase symporter family transporter [Erysipelothrix sp.]